MGNIYKLLCTVLYNSVHIWVAVEEYCTVVNTIIMWWKIIWSILLEYSSPFSPDVSAVQRGSSSGSGSGGGAPSSGTAAGPYQTGVYDSWKTEWNPAYRYTNSMLGDNRNYCSQHVMGVSRKLLLYAKKKSIWIQFRFVAYRKYKYSVT
jgi:hypothetical protein